MENKELLKVSNILINQPLLISARQFDIVMMIGLLLQKRQINFDNEKFIELSVTKNEVKENLSLNEKISTVYIDRLFSDLREKSINYSEEDYNLNVSLISVYERKEENISIFVYEDMARLFLELKNKYTIADFNVITNLTSIYSKKIYLLCMQYRNLDNQREFNIDNLKIILGADSKYKEFQNFKVRVLEKAKKEINKIIPQLKFKYALIKKGREYDSVLFTFDFSFIPKQEPQQEQKASVFDNITPAEPLQYNKNKRVLKSEIPTEEQIYLHMQYSGSRINVKEFIEFYNYRNWQDEQGKPIAWKSKVEKWNSKQDDEEFKRNAELFNKWEKQYENQEKYSQMAEKLKSYNIDDMDFIKEMVDSKLENTFNWELGRLYEINEFRKAKGRHANKSESIFIDKWERRYGYYQ